MGKVGPGEGRGDRRNGCGRKAREREVGGDGRRGCRRGVRQGTAGRECVVERAGEGDRFGNVCVKPRTLMGA